MGQERNRKILKSRSELHQPRRAVARDLLLGHWMVSGPPLNQKESHCPAGLRHLQTHPSLPCPRCAYRYRRAILVILYQRIG